MRLIATFTTRWPWWLLLATFLCLPLGCDCSSNGTGNDQGDAQADVAVPDVDVPDANISDARPDTGSTPCDEDIIVPLPPRGETIVASYGISGPNAMYSEWKTPGQTYMHDVFVFDLATCKEIPVAIYERPQFPATIFGTEIVWTDFRFNTMQPGDIHTELYSYDIQTGVETRLTNSPNSKGVASAIGDYLVFLASDGSAPGGVFSLVLWDRASDDHVLLANYGEGAEGIGLSDQYVTWGAFGASEKDVFIYDIQTGVTTELEQPGSQFVTATDGDYLIFMTEETSTLYHVDLYRYSTGEVTRLDNNGYSRMWPRLKGNLALWVDYGYSQATYGGPRDLVAYDVETGALRRVTAESDTYMGGTIDADWMVYSLPGSGQYMFELYAMNLYRAGVLDELGHVIPE